MVGIIISAETMLEFFNLFLVQVESSVFFNSSYSHSRTSLFRVRRTKTKGKVSRIRVSSACQECWEWKMKLHSDSRWAWDLKSRENGEILFISLPLISAKLCDHWMHPPTFFHSRRLQRVEKFVFLISSLSFNLEFEIIKKFSVSKPYWICCWESFLFLLLFFLFSHVVRVFKAVAKKLDHVGNRILNCSEECSNFFVEHVEKIIIEKLRKNFPVFLDNLFWNFHYIYFFVELCAGAMTCWKSRKFLFVFDSCLKLETFHRKLESMKCGKTSLKTITINFDCIHLLCSILIQFSRHSITSRMSLGIFTQKCVASKFLKAQHKKHNQIEHKQRKILCSGYNWFRLIESLKSQLG